MSTRYPGEPVNHTEEDIRRWALEEARKLITSPELRNVTVPHSIPWIAIDNPAPTDGFAMPTALVTWTASATAPTGALIANGASYLRTAYAALFTAIGTTYGTADATHFNVPNIINAMLIGASGLYALGATGGAATETLGITQIPGHAHTIASDGVHAHDYDIVSNTLTVGGTSVLVPASPNTQTPIGTRSAGSHNHGGTTNSAGSGAAHNNLPPYLALTPIIWT